MTLGQNSAGRDLKVRYMYLGIAMMLGLFALATGLYRLQILRAEEYQAKSVANFIKEVRIQADRGMIKDRRGEILVDNRPSFDLFITPAFCGAKHDACVEAVVPRLQAWFNWDEAERARVEKILKQARYKAPFRPVAVRIDLTREEFDIINARKHELPGVDPLPVLHREYPHLAQPDPPREVPLGLEPGDLPKSETQLSHVLGYMNEISEDEYERLNGRPENVTNKYQLGDYIGRRGIERYFERELRGVDGVRKEVVDAHGRTLVDREGFLVDDELVEPRPGNNVVLSIDMRLQREAERAFPGTAGAVVVVDVKTGFIRAMVSRPNFDANLLTGRVSAKEMAALSKNKLEPMIFRPVQQHYAPGSTFKVVTTLAALRHGYKPSFGAVCTGGYRLGNRTWRCHKDSGHGFQDTRGALQVSCDTWYYKVADQIGLDPIAEEGKALGLGQPTRIGVVAEVPGIMPTEAYHNKVTPGGYTKGMALNSSIGQGDDNVTPLQLAMLYSAIANGGTLYQPQLVERLEDVSGQPVKSFEPKVVRHVDIPEEHRRIVIDALKSVVNEAGGTAYSKRLKDVVIAGKTGTAQVVRLGKERLKTHQMRYFERDNAWFASFAPADDPEIAIVVLNEHGGHGGSDAAPTAMAIYRKYFDLQREERGEVAEAPKAPAPAARRDVVRARPDVAPPPTAADSVPAAGTGGSEPARAVSPVQSEALPVQGAPRPIAQRPPTPAEIPQPSTPVATPVAPPPEPKPEPPAPSPTAGEPVQPPPELSVAVPMQGAVN